MLEEDLTVTNLHARSKQRRGQHGNRFASVEDICRTFFYKCARLWSPREWGQLQCLWSLCPLVVFKSLDQKMRYDYCQSVSNMHYSFAIPPAITRTFSQYLKGMNRHQTSTVCEVNESMTDALNAALAQSK
jgi:hypothetical protein